MNEKNIKAFNFINIQTARILKHECFQSSDVKRIKRNVQEVYSVLLELVHEEIFMNFGLWDKQIFKEYQKLNVNLSSIFSIQDINSQLLLFTLIRPLIKLHFFDKRLLDIGSGTGIGLKASSELLQTNFALGVDLVNKLVTNANRNFYIKDNIIYIQSDAEHLPIGNESFDIITNLESSHVYPIIEHFFSEVERVLAPGGFFCYSDIYVPSKQQTQRLEAFVKTRKNLKIIQKLDLTKMVQASIYRHLIENEKGIYQFAHNLFGKHFSTELPALHILAGLAFLPWWKIWFKNPNLHQFAKHVRKASFWSKKYYFYYLIQKVE
jgi:ubiquinone/menaquinone biosynthesis C-methylase UbiE